MWRGMGNAQRGPMIIRKSFVALSFALVAAACGDSYAESACAGDGGYIIDGGP